MLPALMLLALLAHHSGEPTVFGRYSIRFAIVTTAVALLCASSAMVCWNRIRYERFRSQPLRLFIVLFFLTAIPTAVILDLLMDAAHDPASALVALLCVTVAIVLLVSSRGISRRFLTRLALVMVTVGATVLTCEALFRYVIMDDLTSMSEAGFAARIESSWPRPHTPDRTGGAFRILGVADSFGQIGGPANYHYQLESLLNAQSLDVEMINLSYPEYQLSDYLAMIRRFGERYHPDLVLQGFFVGNDLAASCGPLLEFHGLTVHQNCGIKGFRPRNLVFVEWIRRFAVVLRERARRLHEVEQGDVAATFSQEGFLRATSSQLGFSRKSKPPADRWHSAAQLLDQIRDEVNRLKADYVIVIHPAQYQVEENLQSELFSKLHRDRTEYDLDLPQQFLHHYCESRQVLCLDLLPEMRAKGRNGGLYLRRDTHYNEKGNKIAAKAIAEFLESRAVVPRTLKGSSR